MKKPYNPKDHRQRCEIINLRTGIIYSSELTASKQTGFSRYYIRKSIKEGKQIKNCQFAYYAVNQRIEALREVYGLE